MMRFASRVVLLVFLLLLFPAQRIWAIGTEFTLSGSDLIVDVNTKWAGCTQGGYYPVRVSVRNNGKPRTITLEIRQNNSYQRCPWVTRSVSLEQNASIDTTLLVPMVSDGTYVEFRVLERGRAIKNLARAISLPELTSNDEIGSEMLIVARKAEDAQMYDSAVNQIFLTSSSYRHRVSEYAQHVRPQKLPANWLAYTGLDILAVPLDIFSQEISVETRGAILEWVASGGNLLVYQVGEPVRQSRLLEDLLELNKRAFRGSDWETLDVKLFRRVTMTNLDDPSTSSPEDLSQGDRWKLIPGNFGTRSFGLGRVTAMSENPFPGTASHWIWLLNQLSHDRLLWHRRNGIVSRGGNDSFFQFLIPNVGSVPVLSMLILITLFTIVIGPVNYIYFLKKRQLAMLLITVPVIAFGSSILLLGYSTIAHGFSIKSRIRSVTFLDQKQNHAMSISRVAYYAGMAPSAGLQFEPTTAVYPIWPSEKAFESARVNWTEKQHLQNGWLRSRTRTQFLTVSQKEQRGRIELQAITSETPEVSNGLEWDIRTLYLVDSSGKKWVARNLKSGAVEKLEPATDESGRELLKELSRYSMSLPVGTDGRLLSSDMLSGSSRYAYRYYNYIQPNYQKSLQEQVLPGSIVTGGFTFDSLKPGSYFAVLDRAPDLDLGSIKATENISIHLLFGYF